MGEQKDENRSNVSMTTSLPVEINSTVEFTDDEIHHQEEINDNHNEDTSEECNENNEKSEGNEDNEDIADNEDNEDHEYNEDNEDNEDSEYILLVSKLEEHGI